MANSDKNIVITPNISSTTADPKIVFSGADASTSAQNITLQAYPTNSGTLSFEGSAGQLFSISNTMTGTIYSVNDVSGIPSIEVLDNGLVKLAQYSGNIVLGSSIDNGIAKLQVTGNQTVTGKTIYGPNTTWGAYLQVGGSSREYVDNGTYASVAASDGNLHLDAGSGKDLYLNYYDGSSIRFGNGANSYVGSINTSGDMVLNGALTVGNGANSSNIYMYDSDEGTRVIHSNSNYIGFLTQASNWGARCDDSGNWWAAGTISADSNISSGGGLGVSNTSSTTGTGISLYNGGQTGIATYGISFTGTSVGGTYGDVTADWATYFTMNNTSGRGWVFRDVSTPNNVASISIAGNATFAGYVKANGIQINSYNTQNARIYTNNGGASGLLITDNTGSYRVQIYGDGSNYGFLDSAWGNWDVNKTVNGQMYLRVSGSNYNVLHAGNYNTYTASVGKAMALTR